MSAYHRSLTVLSALALAGLVAILLAWRSVADLLAVSIQLPYAVSGALGGLAILGFALGLIAIQATRRAEARERAQFGRLVRASAALLAEVRASS